MRFRSDEHGFRVGRHEHRIEIESGCCDLRSGERIEQLDDLLRRSIRPEVQSIRIGLSGVSDADTRLLAVLVQAKRLARVTRTRIIVVPSRTVRSWAEVCRLSDILAI